MAESNPVKKRKYYGKRKKVKYRKISFKITQSQYLLLQKHCKSQKTTVVKSLKSTIKKQIHKYTDKNYVEPKPVPQNQLSLFDFDVIPEQKPTKKAAKQKKLFE